MAGDSAGFEGHLWGSWWDVQIEDERLSNFLIRYTAADEDEPWAWVPLTELRLSTRKADDWDCRRITKGLDVAVFAKHPHTNCLLLADEGLYDGRVSSVARSSHVPGKCSCKFYVQFFKVKLDTSIDGTHGNLFDRILVTDQPEIEVSISDIRILQKPVEIIPLRQLLDAHRDRRWIPLGRSCQDACFLAETELSTAKRPTEAFVRDDIDPAQVRCAEVLSPSPARISEDDAVKGAGGHADGGTPKTTNIRRESFSAECHDNRRSNGIVSDEPSKRKRDHPMCEDLQRRQNDNTFDMANNHVQLSSDTSESETEWRPLPSVKKLANTSSSSMRTRKVAVTHKPKPPPKPRRIVTRSGTKGPSPPTCLES